MITQTTDEEQLNRKEEFTAATEGESLVKHKVANIGEKSHDSCRPDEDVNMEDVSVQGTSVQEKESFFHSSTKKAKRKFRPKGTEVMSMTKLALHELEYLPPDWIMKEYTPGIFFYFHLPTRVVTTTRPYMLGTGSIKKHKLCTNSIPCFDYVRTRSKADATNMNAVSEEIETEVSKDETRTETNQVPESQKQCHSDSVKKNEDNFVAHDELLAYFKKLYRHKTIKIRKFNSWKMKRAFVHKQKCKNKITKNVSAAPGNNLIIVKIAKLNTRTNKIEQTDWTLNPNGKSYVCLLHEYLQRSIKTHPWYVCKELENAKTPYMATIKLNKMDYGSGIGSSKKEAKSEAAKATLEILIPQLKILWKKDDPEAHDENNYSLFDTVPILDENVRFYCESLNEQQPYNMLKTCIEKNFGPHRITHHKKTVGPNENIFSLKVLDITASVHCTNTKEGRQKASQKMLQKLHPQIHYLGSLFRLYGNSGVKGIKEKKELSDEDKTNKRSLSDDEPNFEILNSLRETMAQFYADRQHLLEEGQFETPDNIEEIVMGMYKEMKEKCKKKKRSHKKELKKESDDTVLEKPIDGFKEHVNVDATIESLAEQSSL